MTYIPQPPRAGGLHRSSGCKGESIAHGKRISHDQGRRSALGRTRSRVRLADDGIGKILRPHFGRCPMAMAAKPDTACGGAGPGLVLMLVRLQIGTRRD